MSIPCVWSFKSALLLSVADQWATYDTASLILRLPSVWVMMYVWPRLLNSAQKVMQTAWVRGYEVAIYIGESGDGGRETSGDLQTCTLSFPTLAPHHSPTPQGEEYACTVCRTVHTHIHTYIMSTMSWYTYFIFYGDHIVIFSLTYNISCSSFISCRI